MAATKKAPAKKVAPKKAAKSQAKKKSAAQPRREVGAPSKYTEALGKAICGWLIQGYTLRQIEAQAGMPCKRTILYWLSEHEEFMHQYARAREAQAFGMEDEILEIADNSTNDWVERENQRTGETFIALNDEAIQRAKARIDARKWLMGKMAPKRFGERIKVGNDPDNPLPTPMGVILVPAKKPTEDDE